MDKDSLYWILSTLPQVSAAFVAFIGFLVLWKSDKLMTEKTRIEEIVRQGVLHSNITLKPGLGKVPEIEAIRGTEVLARLRETVTNPSPEQSKKGFEYYTRALKIWDEADLAIKRLTRTLIIFVVIQLAVILFSLWGLPNTPSLAGVSLGWVFVTVIAFMVGSTGYMLFVCLRA